MRVWSRCGDAVAWMRAFARRLHVSSARKRPTKGVLPWSNISRLPPHVRIGSPLAPPSAATRLPTSSSPRAQPLVFCVLAACACVGTCLSVPLVDRQPWRLSHMAFLISVLALCFARSYTVRHARARRLRAR